VSYGLVWDTLEGAVFGFALAFVIYWALNYAAHAIRLIDLASFALGFVALIGGLLAWAHSRGTHLESLDQLIIKSAIVDISFDTTVESFKICDRVRHTPYKPRAINKEECGRLNRYVGSLSFDPITVAPLRVPNAESYTDPEVRKLAEQTFARVEEVNGQIAAFVQNHQTYWKTEVLDGLVREISLPIFAFAFGLGVARRTIDLYLVLPPRVKAPVERCLKFARRLVRRSRRRISLLLTRAPLRD
jgi:hypothetical protein